MLSTPKGVKIRVDDRIISNLKIWKNSLPSKTIFVNRGKKTKHSLQIIASLALRDSSTTREIAKFTIEKTGNYPYAKPRDEDSRKLEKLFCELITGRLKKKTGRKKSQEKYPSLESNYYVRKLGKKKNEKNKDVNLYSLNFIGFLFSLGFNFQGKDFEKFLHNAAKHHLFFAYVQKIAKSTSYPFAKEIFLDPIFEMIKDGKIILDENISFYFSNIAEGIGKSLTKLGDELESIEDDEQSEKEQFARKIKKWTYYDDRPTHDWPYAMMDIFYRNDEDYEFFEEHAHHGMERNLLYKVMQKVHLVYFGYGGNFIPRRTQKIPISKRWKEHQKYHPEYKGPRDHDNKRKIKIRYDADFIPS